MFSLGFGSGVWRRGEGCGSNNEARLSQVGFLDVRADLLLGIGIPFTIKVVGEPGQQLAVRTHGDVHRKQFEYHVSGEQQADSLFTS